MSFEGEDLRINRDFDEEELLNKSVILRQINNAPSIKEEEIKTFSRLI